jgi:hypothetical protein
MTEEKSLDLITGLLVSNDSLRVIPGATALNSYIMDTWNRGAVLLLDLTGAYATQVQYVTARFNQLVPVPSCYVDKQGIEDHGFCRGMYLVLNRERLNTIMDDFLSGRLCEFVRI